MINLEITAGPEADINILDEYHNLIGTLYFDSNMPSRITKALTTEADLELIEDCNKPYQTMFVGPITLDINYISKEIIKEVFSKMSYYALFNSYTALQMLVTEESMKSTFKDLGFEVKGYLVDLKQYIVEKPLK